MFSQILIRLFNKTSNNVFLLAPFEAIIRLSMFMELCSLMIHTQFYPIHRFILIIFQPIFLWILQWINCCDFVALCHFNSDNDPLNIIAQLQTIDSRSVEVESSKTSRWAEQKRELMNLRKCLRKVRWFLETLLNCLSTFYNLLFSNCIQKLLVVFFLFFIFMPGMSLQFSDEERQNFSNFMKDFERSCSGNPQIAQNVFGNAKVQSAIKAFEKSYDKKFPHGKPEK